jgi:hypothetical protein
MQADQRMIRATMTLGDERSCWWVVSLCGGDSAILGPWMESIAETGKETPQIYICLAPQLITTGTRCQGTVTQ